MSVLVDYQYILITVLLLISDFLCKLRTIELRTLEHGPGDIVGDEDSSSLAVQRALHVGAKYVIVKLCLD
jgi:hypothetical protein